MLGRDGVLSGAGEGLQRKVRADINVIPERGQ